MLNLKVVPGKNYITKFRIQCAGNCFLQSLVTCLLEDPTLLYCLLEGNVKWILETLIEGMPSMTSSDGKNVPSMTIMKHDEQASTVCTFKRGGMCIIHNVVGSKFSVSRKDWAQKKDGTYGYVYKKITKYTCKEARRPTNIPVKNVINDNEDSALTGSAPLEDGPLYGIQGTRISSNDVSGDNQGISGGGNPGLAASFESES